MSPKCLILLGTVILSLSFRSTKALSCPPGHNHKDLPDQTPICCLSGWATSGVCGGARANCASGEGEECIDLWRRKECAVSLKCHFEDNKNPDAGHAGKCVPKKGEDEKRKWQTKVPKCKSNLERLQCRCAEDHKSKCVPVPESKGDSTTSKFGWCFLENMHYDTSKPKTYCYGDVRFSGRFGRFYSHQACDPKQKPSDIDPNEYSGEQHE